MLHSVATNLFVLRGTKKFILASADSLVDIINYYEEIPPHNQDPKKLEVIQFRAQSFQKKVSMKRLLRVCNKLGDKPIDLNEI